MAYDTLCIGGGFDVLHADHKGFIEKCLENYSRKYGNPAHLVVMLVSDEKLSSLKGAYRPFFSFEWRNQDMHDFLTNKNLDFHISKNSLISGLKDIDKNKSIIAVRPDDAKVIKTAESQGFKLISVSPLNRLHTTDIEKRLLVSKEKSNCKIRKVGALLVRGGEIVREGFSGNGDCNCCSKYKVYSVAGIACQNVPCDFPHAEEVCLEYAREGDDLFVTCSPCMACAEKIVSKGIRRVVFLEEYYDIKPLEYLRKNDVLFRKAGIN